MEHCEPTLWMLELLPALRELGREEGLHPALGILLGWLEPTPIGGLLEGMAQLGHGWISRTIEPNELRAWRRYYDGDQQWYLCETIEIVLDWDRDRISVTVGPNNEIYEEYGFPLREYSLLGQWDRWGGHWNEVLHVPCRRVDNAFCLSCRERGQ